MNCFKHIESPATHTCEKCGNYLCLHCAKWGQERGGVLWCDRCLIGYWKEQKAEVLGLQQARRNTIIRTMTACLLWALALIVFMLVPSSWTPVSFAIFGVSLVVALPVIRRQSSPDEDDYDHLRANLHARVGGVFGAFRAGRITGQIRARSVPHRYAFRFVIGALLGYWLTPAVAAWELLTAPKPSEKKLAEATRALDVLKSGS